MPQSLRAEFLALRNEYIENCFGRLNPEQKKAVFVTDGPLLILAGAGSGKTTVLVNRIANLIRFGKAHGSEALGHAPTQEEVDALRAAVKAGQSAPAWLESQLRVEAVRPWNILAITFTNKAAGELKARLQNMLGGEEGRDVFASTFHSACVRILRQKGEAVGLPPSFTIYDTDDSQRAMKEVYKQLMVDDKYLPLKTCMNRISHMKDQMISPKEALASPADSKAGLIAKIYQAYQARLASAGAVDFDDLIYKTVCLLRDNENIREYYQNRFRYVLVDEYQDTSVAQFHLVRLLTGPAMNVCVVGDDDQSIYKFRGATIENILNFEKIFPHTQTIRLEQNYRSTSNILNAANGVIANNANRKGKTLWTKNGEGAKVHHYLAASEQEEAAHVAEIIGQHLREGARLGDHAILYRQNAQSGPVETYFARAGIAYKLVGGHRFYDRKEVKDILAYMSLVANPADDLRLRRIINVPARKIGATTVDAIAALAAREQVSMLHIVQRCRDYKELSRASAALENFARLYGDLCESAASDPLDLFVSDLIETTGYKRQLEAEGEEGQTRLENLGQLVSAVRTYADQQGPSASLAGYLEEAALISDLDDYDEKQDCAVMMTLHSAKGLEFPYVFILGLEDGIFPSDRSAFSEEELEEERRLCYVGITRAKQELWLSSAVTRMLYGQTRRNEPSRFLQEIDSDYMDEDRSPLLAAPSRPSWSGAAVPGGASGYSGPSRGGYYSNRGADQDDGAYYPRSAYGGYGSARGRSGYSGYRSGNSRTSGGRSGYLSREYNVTPHSKTSAQTLPYGAAGGLPPIATPRPSAGPAVRYAPGDVVEHKVFGRGVVLEVTPTSNDQIVKIAFEKVGEKRTMANYAPLTKVNPEGED